jgi:hypothetical protein
LKRKCNCFVNAVEPNKWLQCRRQYEPRPPRPQLRFLSPLELLQPLQCLWLRQRQRQLLRGWRRHQADMRQSPRASMTSKRYPPFHRWDSTQSNKKNRIKPAHARAHLLRLLVLLPLPLPLLLLDSFFQLQLPRGLQPRSSGQKMKRWNLRTELPSPSSRPIDTSAAAPMALTAAMAVRLHRHWCVSATQWLRPMRSAQSGPMNSPQAHIQIKVPDEDRPWRMKEGQPLRRCRFHPRQTLRPLTPQRIQRKRRLHR